MYIDILPGTSKVNVCTIFEQFLGYSLKNGQPAPEPDSNGLKPWRGEYGYTIAWNERMPNSDTSNLNEIEFKGVQSANWIQRQVGRFSALLWAYARKPLVAHGEGQEVRSR